MMARRQTPSFNFNQQTSIEILFAKDAPLVTIVATLVVITI